MRIARSVVRSSALGCVVAMAALSGCSDRQDGASSSASAVVRGLRDQFPEQASVVLQQDDSFKLTDAGFVLKDFGARGSWQSVQIELPRDGKQTIRFTTESGLQVRVREIGVEGPGEMAEQAISYARNDGTSFWAAVPGGYEEWLHIKASSVKSTTPVAVWHVEGASIRQANDSVEIVDGSGATQIRVTAPQAFAAGGRPIETRLSGAEGRIELYVTADDEDVLVDPIWGAGGAMSVTRAWARGTLLSDGRVLVTGGANSATTHNTAETYNPTTNTWSATANTMITPRRDHTSVLLWTNKVLLAGGFSGSANLLTAELFDPATNLWSATGSMTVARRYAPAVQLGNGKVLIAGGLNSASLSSAELYDPTAGTWATTGAMVTARYQHSVTLLPNGKVLVAGGSSTSGNVASAELYDPVLGTWSATGSMTTPRRLHTATLLNDGKVLVTGGVSTTPLNTAELYDPTTGIWSSSGVGVMSIARTEHSATLLDNGRVLVVGGNNGSTTTASVEQYNPGTKQFASAGTLGTSRHQHLAARLQSGKVLVAGGWGSAVTYLASSELYLLPTNAACIGNGDCQSGFCIDGICCNNACGNGDNTDCQACNAIGSEGICAPSTGGFVCRAATDACDVAESCDGMGTTCPADDVAAAGTVCRPLAPSSTCDVVEQCNGVVKQCPMDSFKPSGTLCRTAVSVCDVTENCTGSSAFCPPDAFVPAGTECRGAAGVCDIAENCLGNTPFCPADAFVAAGTQCLNGPGLCSPTRVCTGSTAMCP